MFEEGLRSCLRAKFVVTIGSVYKMSIAENMLNRGGAMNKEWLGTVITPI